MAQSCLKSDANVDLVHFTILRPPDKSTDGTPINELSLIAFPVADLFGRKIKDFDLIIFDRYSTQAVLPQVYLDNIVRYVREGGALMLAVGPEFETPEGLFNTPIGEISPARPTGEDFLAAFRPEISADGAEASGHARASRLRGEPAGLGRLVPRHRRQTHVRRQRDAGGPIDAAAGAVARRQGPRRAVALRSDLAVGARLRRRRPASRPAAPARALADEGAGARGGGAARPRARAGRDDRAPEPEGRNSAGRR